MTNQEKLETAIFFFKKHGSLYNYGKIFDDYGNVKENISLKDIENAIKTDKYLGFPCDHCLRMVNDFCSLSGKKPCVSNLGYPHWRFPYRYWNGVMKRERISM